jgi:hypothetical protein
MTSDSSELESLAADFQAIPARLVPKVEGVVSKGALNIKNRLRRDAEESEHFGMIGATINYDLVVGEFAGDASIEASIGPNATIGGAAQLAGAYYGWSRGGGGTLPDPVIALEEEEPRFVENLATLAGFLFDD